MRLVDADVLTIALKRKAPISDAMRVMWAECLEEVRHAPTIDPVRNGKWIPKFNGAFTGGAYWFECSECGHTVAGGLDSGKYFCERCGCNMKGEQDG